MKAVIVEKPGDESVLKIAEVPDPAIKPDELLIRVRAAGLKEAQKWMAQCAAFWDSRFDQLNEVLKSEQRKENKR